MITAAQLRAIMPGAGKRADLFTAPLIAAMLQFDISSPARAAGFLAQVAHESGQLVYVQEIASGKAYEGREDLGNVEAGDGVRFKGRGLIQVTGRKNYVLCGFALHLDLTAHPELLEQPQYAAASAGWYWHANNLNRFADAGDFKGLSIAINGRNKATGLPNGWEDRQLFWARAKNVLGVKGC